MNNTLPEKLLSEIRRLREELLPQYESIGNSGKLAIELTIKPAIKLGEDALASGDAIEMLLAYKKLKVIC